MCKSVCHLLQCHYQLSLEYQQQPPLDPSSYIPAVWKCTKYPTNVLWWLSEFFHSDAWHGRISEWRNSHRTTTWNFNLVVGSFMMISPSYGSTSKQIAKLLMKLGCKVSHTTLTKIKPLNWKQKLENKPQHGGEKLHASWITFAPFWVPSPPIM